MVDIEEKKEALKQEETVILQAIKTIEQTQIEPLSAER
jgi:hypothetical protein